MRLCPPKPDNSTDAATCVVHFVIECPATHLIGGDGEGLKVAMHTLGRSPGPSCTEPVSSPIDAGNPEGSLSYFGASANSFVYDARDIQISEGTNEVPHIVVARHLLT